MNKKQIEENCNNNTKLDFFTANILEAYIVNESTFKTIEFKEALRAASNEEFLSFIYALKLLHDSASNNLVRFKDSRYPEFVTDKTITERLNIIEQFLDKNYHAED